MKIKVFEPNRYGKIEFTRAELEKLLNEVYTDGYREGEYEAHTRSWTWASPYLSTSGTSICNKATVDPAITLTSANCAADKIEAVLDNSVATVCDKTSKDTDGVYVYTYTFDSLATGDTMYLHMMLGSDDHILHSCIFRQLHPFLRIKINGIKHLCKT